MASVGLPSHDGACACVTRPKYIKPRLNNPMPGSRIHCHATVLSTVGTMNGSSSRARVMAFIRKFWCITSAMPRPPANLSTVAAPVKRTVFQAACQKIASFQSLSKLAKPTKVAGWATGRLTKVR